MSAWALRAIQTHRVVQEITTHLIDLERALLDMLPNVHMHLVQLEA